MQTPRKFSVVAGRPIEASAPEPAAETPLARARRRYGKPFKHTIGSEFIWTHDPHVLTDWMHGRRKP